MSDSTNTDELSMMKATDPTSSFAEAGTNPELVAGQAVGSIASFQVSDVLHVAAQVGNGAIYYASFNMATDTWGTPVSVDTSNAGVSEDGIAIVVDGSGVITIVYVGDHHATSFNSIYRARSTDSGSTWGTPAQIDDNSSVDFAAPRAVLGDSDAVHCVFVGSQNIYQIALNSSGTAQTFRDTTFDCTGSTPNDLYDGVSFDRSGTTKIRFTYRQAASADPNVLEFDAAADPSTFGSTELSTDNLASGGMNFSIAVDTGLDHVWGVLVDSLNDIKYVEDQASDDWSNGYTNLETGTFDRLRCNVYSRGGNFVLGYMAFNGSSHTYNEHVIRADSGGGASATTLSSHARHFTPLLVR